MTAQTIVGSDYLGVAGNNERWFPLHLGLFVLASAVLIIAWSRVDRADVLLQSGAASEATKA